ncbi:unnamed protein product [Calypogeia fissa]
MFAFCPHSVNKNSNNDGISAYCTLLKEHGTYKGLASDKRISAVDEGIRRLIEREMSYNGRYRISLPLIYDCMSPKLRLGSGSGSANLEFRRYAVRTAPSGTVRTARSGSSLAGGREIGRADGQIGGQAGGREGGEYGTRRSGGSGGLAVMGWAQRGERLIDSQHVTGCLGRGRVPRGTQSEDHVGAAYPIGGAVQAERKF